MLLLLLLIPTFLEHESAPSRTYQSCPDNVYGEFLRNDDYFQISESLRIVICRFFIGGKPFFPLV